MGPALLPACVGLAAMRALLALALPVKTCMAVMAAAHEFEDDPLLVAVDAKRDGFMPRP